MVDAVSREGLQQRLLALGFSSVLHFTADDAHRRYYIDRRDGLIAPRWEELIVATV